MAQCGACSVLLDGEEVRACITPISYAVGKQVTTIEGLPAVWGAEKSLSPADAAKTLHPIQQAWIDEQVSAVRLLPQRDDDVPPWNARQEPQSVRCTNQDAFTNKPPVTASLPLRHLLRHHRSHTARCQGHEGLREGLL